ncbi:hypothetical protein HGRIS_013853 [Hohenbuehelia grisea]|uniref:TERF2-interacting telomeric protein 1 Myb domain-containing protein n=1 Tax=Hohenbuehelia grisea TaxID=104357 RepID=A0ABR3IWR9_9AGAR
MAGGRVPFTHDDEKLLTSYIATYNPGLNNRRGNALYKQLTENRANTWQWAQRHSWQSWRDQYVKNANWYDQQIRKYQKKHDIKVPEPVSGFKYALKRVTSESSDGDSDGERATKSAKKQRSVSPQVKCEEDSISPNMQKNLESDLQPVAGPSKTKDKAHAREAFPSPSPRHLPATSSAPSEAARKALLDFNEDEESEPSRAANRGSVAPNEYSNQIFTQDSSVTRQNASPLFTQVLDEHPGYLHTSGLHATQRRDSPLFTQDLAATQPESTSLRHDSPLFTQDFAATQQSVTSLVTRNTDANRNGTATDNLGAAAIMYPSSGREKESPRPESTLSKLPEGGEVPSLSRPEDLTKLAEKSSHSIAPAPSVPRGPAPPKHVERRFGGNALVPKHNIDHTASSDDDGDEDLRPNWPPSRSQAMRRTAGSQSRGPSGSSDLAGKAVPKAGIELRTAEEHREPVKSKLAAPAPPPQTNAIPTSSRVTLDVLHPVNTTIPSSLQAEQPAALLSTPKPTPVMPKSSIRKPMATIDLRPTAGSAKPRLKPTRLLFDDEAHNPGRTSATKVSPVALARSHSHDVPSSSGFLLDDNPFLVVDDMRGKAKAKSVDPPQEIRRHTLAGQLPAEKPPKVDLRVKALRHAARHSISTPRSSTAPSRSRSSSKHATPALPGTAQKLPLSTPATDESIIAQMGTEAAMARLVEYWGFDEEIVQCMHEMTGSLVGADRGLCFIRMKLESAIREYAELLESNPTPVHINPEPSKRRKELLKTPSRPRKLALQYTPTRRADEERAIPYIPPETSRAGRFIQLVSQGRIDEALEREGRRASRAWTTPLLHRGQVDAGPGSPPMSISAKDGPRPTVQDAEVRDESEDGEDMESQMDVDVVVWGDDEDQLVLNARRPDEDELIALERRVGELFMRENILRLLQA